MSSNAWSWIAGACFGTAVTWFLSLHTAVSMVTCP